MKNQSPTRLQRLVSPLLCLVLLYASAAFADNDSYSEHEPVGKITGLASAASESGSVVTDKSSVQSNDVLATNRSGRLRIQLRDGSVLGMGSDTQLRIRKHDSSTGESLVELSGGRLRSRVVKVRKTGSRFQIVTPHARISVIGTDFFVDVTSQRTQVVVYTGIVLVAMKTGPSAVDVAAGQSTTVDSNGISRLGLTPEDYERETMVETAVPGEVYPAANETAQESAPQKPHSHLKRNIAIGAAVAAGALAAGLAARRGTSSTPSSSTTTPSTIPSIPPR
jgi:ferric-dicitrate binding protein FerR (iron transport regulator)